MASRTASPALGAYEAMASTYDAFTAGYDYDRWLDRIESIAQRLGLRGRRLLDVGCGTGKSAAPLLRRGYDVCACDLSPRMAALATRRLGPAADVLVADMRDLPAHLGSFDLITCLDDAINYLTTTGDLRAAFASAQRLLEPDGVYVFDVNTLAAYRSSFAQDFIVESGDTVFCWRGANGSDGAAGPDEAHRAQLDAFVQRADGTWSRVTSVHEQRHFSDAVIQEALADAGLSCVELLGQEPGVKLAKPADELRHAKRLYFARHADH